ncbi:AAA family ATPase [Desulfosarcina cetonica]|uniref:AAA family ATPase n=1 Tax=Desulfosarcina cetonica TaxID=90730 RepID=UPI000A8B315C|nr:ATP-binding protein [Desulfosarcina cetonica]
MISDNPDIAKSAMVIPPALETRIDRIIHEYRQQSKLKAHGLTHRRKILLIGPPGTGKTMTAKVLAHELRLPLHTIQVDRLVTKFMGETSAKLRQIFDLIQSKVGVYLFDEFDAIGGERSLENDVGEMRRVLNAFLQFIEQDASDSIIVAATNSPKLLDRALFRRFDDVMYYEPPTDEERRRLIENVLGTYLGSRFAWKQVIADSRDLSHAEIDQACRDAIKHMILSEKNAVTATDLLMTINEKNDAHRGSRR